MVSALMSQMSSVKVFKCSHQTNWHGCQRNGILVFLRGGPCQKLQSDCHQACSCRCRITWSCRNGVSSLLLFTNLESLEVGVAVSGGLPGENRRRVGERMRLMRGNSWINDNIPCLRKRLLEDIREAHTNTDNLIKPGLTCTRDLVDHTR